MQLKIGDIVHSFVTGHYGYVVDFKRNGDIAVCFPAYIEDCTPDSIEPDPRRPDPTIR